MYVTFEIVGEYSDYIGMKLTKSELKTIQKFIEEVNMNNSNINIRIINIEN